MEDQPPAQEVEWSYGEELTLDQKDHMLRLVSDYSRHFAFGVHDLGRYTTHQMRLDLIDSKPVFCLGTVRLGWSEILSTVKSRKGASSGLLSVPLAATLPLPYSR